MSYYDECLKRFKLLSDDLKNKIGSLEVLNKIQELEAEYEVELKFLVILVAIGELAIKDIPAYLVKKSGLDPEEAMEIKRELVNEVFYLILDDEQQANLEPTNRIKKIFQGNLFEILKNQDNAYKKTLNQEIILTLSDESLNQEELLKNLYANQEQLTSGEFILEEKREKPTIANWLKDFIKAGVIEKGIDFDRAQYFNKNKNFINLTISDRELIAKLLELFIRLKFFPEGLEKLPTEDWYIIPYDKEETKIKKLETKQLERVSAPIATDLNQDLIKIYYQTLDKYRDLKNANEELLEKTANDNNLIMTELISGINNKKILLVLAALSRLAENNSLALLKQDQKFIFIFQKEKKLPASEWQSNFDLNYLKIILPWLLIQKLGMTENDAAVFALKLANILRRNGDNSFMKIAYGDIASQSFKFS